MELRGECVHETRIFAGDSSLSLAKNMLYSIRLEREGSAIRASGFILSRACAVGIFSAGSDVIRKFRWQAEEFAFLPIDMEIRG